MKHFNLRQKPVILCVGTQKVSGDMLGPMVGSILTEKYNINSYVYGTLNNPVNGLNIEEYISFIKKIHSKSLIITVDAAMGLKNEVGLVKLKKDGIVAGAAFGRKKKTIGIGLVGVVAEKDDNPINKLMTVKVSFVECLAEKIATVIDSSINSLKKYV